MCPDLQVRLVLWDLQDLRVVQGCKAFRDNQVHQELLEQQEVEVYRVPRVPMAILVGMVLAERLDCLVLRGLVGLLVLLVSLDHVGNQVFLVLLVSMAFLVCVV